MVSFVFLVFAFVLELKMHKYPVDFLTMLAVGFSYLNYWMLLLHSQFVMFFFLDILSWLEYC